MVTFALSEVLIASLVFSFIFAFLVTPFLIFNSRKAKILGVDRNKKGEKIPELGGIAIVAGTSIGIMASIALGFNLELNIQVLLAALSTVVIMGVLGIIDDLYSLQKKIKAPIPFIAAIPLSAVRAGTRTLHIPTLGTINFGTLYPLAIVPLGVGGASNAFNMLAGLNGLEAGMGMVISLAVFTAAYLHGSFEAMIISISLLGACVAFLFYNRFPAKIFPGDVGTYTIGATIASAVIVGNLEFFGLVLFTPYFIEFIMKARTGFRGQNYGEYRNGKLLPPKKAESLTHLIMKLRPMSEKEVVYHMLVIEAIVAIIALMYFI